MCWDIFIIKFSLPYPFTHAAWVVKLVTQIWTSLFCWVRYKKRIYYSHHVSTYTPSSLLILFSNISLFNLIPQTKNCFVLIPSQAKFLYLFNFQEIFILNINLSHVSSSFTTFIVLIPCYLCQQFCIFCCTLFLFIDFFIYSIFNFILIFY